MDMRHLRVFMTVCRLKNISSAASELGVNQPAISKAVRRLEGELGVPLFERVPRGVELTPYGEILRRFAGDIDANYRGALRHIDAIRTAEGGMVVVGAGGTWRDEILPRAVATLCLHRPRAKVRINTGTTGDLQAELLRGELDFLLAPVELDDALSVHLKAEILLDNALVVAARAGHPAADGLPRALADLADLPWAAPIGSIVRERFNRLFLAHGLEPPIPALEVQDASCLFDVVEATDLLTYVPDIRLSGARMGRIVTVNVPEATDRRQSGLIIRRRGLLPPLCLELIGIIRSQLPDTGLR